MPNPGDGPFRSRQDLVLQVLSELGVLSTGQPVDPENYTKVDTQLDSLRRTIEALDIVTIPSLDQVPSQYMIPFAKIVAGEVGSNFNLTDDDIRKAKAEGLGLPIPDGMGPGSGHSAMILKQMRRSKPTGEILDSDFF
jgi:hypothetical protein